MASRGERVSYRSSIYLLGWMDMIFQDLGDPSRPSLAHHHLLVY